MHTDPYKSTHARPSVKEIAIRIARLCDRMREAGVTTYVSLSTDNVFYLTNFANYVHERPFVLVISDEGKLRFIVPKLEIPHVTMRAIGDIELVEYAEFPAPDGSRWIDRLHDLLPANGKVGIEATCPRFLSDAITGPCVVADLIDDLRAVKSPYEIGRIQYASDLASAVHAEFLSAAAPGLTLSQASSFASRKLMPTLVADEPSLNMFATKIGMVFQPPHISHDPHNFTDIAMMMTSGGPHISILNGVMNGYGTEIERTFFLGSVPEAARCPFDTMLEARHRALELVKPGNLMSDVDRVANDIFRKAGYADAMLHRTGHGIGVTGHEGPFFAEGYDREIEPDMVFTIEPGIYLPGVGGFRHSDTIRVGATGPIMMTQGDIALEDLVFDPA